LSENKVCGVLDKLEKCLLE
ncbi:unnamed protein product, partial [Allacma fusca]